jgi:hypothetical protein
MIRNKKILVLLTDLKIFFTKFFHQLRLLLWKSFLIKKRSPVSLFLRFFLCFTKLSNWLVCIIVRTIRTISIIFDYGWNSKKTSSKTS